ncbi:uncharacterized protein LALA0_S12e00144g [Lachancea lanzarotensis]|uniref:LALA0S12e00144g1_1 n=1 Tax=Lachancea lanzarotensis TaxID=1245769 RepID=A0A0C7MWX5_9SACH|nr:uncharacterized protein LALA0_S12e00144g [Lachancea lanzarotensis]CEP64497.1 LALA0S12e00144g1_1 [Lachancea lanzarotensis]
MTPSTDSKLNPTAWYSHSALLVAVRVAQFVSTITTLGLTARLVDNSNEPNLELTVSVISLAFFIVIAAAPLPLNLYSLVAMCIFETDIFALWVAASGTLSSGYSDICTFYSGNNDRTHVPWEVLAGISKECKIGKTSIAFTAFSTFFFLCSVALLCMNVLVPIKARSVRELSPQDTRAYLSRFTALSITHTPVRDVVKRKPE